MQRFGSVTCQILKEDFGVVAGRRRDIQFAIEQGQHLRRTLDISKPEMTRIRLYNIPSRADRSSGYRDGRQFQRLFKRFYRRAILNNGRIFALRWGVQQGERICTAMPFFHAGGCVLGILAALGVGATLHPLMAFDPLKTLQVLSSEHCARFGGVPTMLIAMMQHPEFEQVVHLTG